MPESASVLDRKNQLYHQAQGRMVLLPNYYSWIYNKISPFIKGDVLELGAGTGLFLRHYLNTVSSVCAVDYNETILSYLQKNTDPGKVLTLHCDLRKNWSELQNLSFDCVIALDVLEHFENDHDFLMKVHCVLKKGGRFLVKVPAQSQLYSAIDEASGHYRRYDKEILTRRFTDSGFREIIQLYMNPLGALVYSFKKKKKTNFSKTFSPLALRYINLLLPLISTLDSLPGLKGLSLIGVYEKK